MCLESSKQNYAVLKALVDHREGGVDHTDLASEAKKSSNALFGSDLYGYKPIPFQSKLSALLADGEVAMGGDGIVQITAKGESALSFLEKEEICADGQR